MRKHAPTLGLAVVVKNSAETLRACLKSVDAMVVVDTGSTDETVEIARQSGAKTVLFPWTGDFSEARNAALAAIGTDWVLVLDADEELDREAHAWIREELKAPKADDYVTPVRNYLQPAGEALVEEFAVAPGEQHPHAPHAVTYVHSEVCRLYRRAPDVYYIGHVHEQVEYRMLELGRSFAKAGFFIHHFGWYLIDEEGVKRKHTLYRGLLEKKLQQRPHDAQVYIQYGDALCNQEGKAEEGLVFFMKAAALNPKDREVWTHIAAALLKMGQFDGALVAIEQMPSHGSFAGRRFVLQGEALGALKRWKEARSAYGEVVKKYPNYLRIQAKLALLEMETGDEEQGMVRMRATVVAAEAQAGALQHAHLFFGVAQLHSQTKQWPDVLRLVSAGLLLNSRMVPLHALRLVAAVAMGRLEEAEEAAAKVVELEPSVRSIMKHVGILNHFGKREEACGVITRGLELFPMSNELQQAERELEAMLPVAMVPMGTADGYGMQAFGLCSSPQA